MMPTIANADLSAEVVATLLLPGTYPGRPAGVTMRETHISWVFLTGTHAYKLKKPVQFPFLDFTTLDKRKEACDAELTLNRRLAPHVYLGVVPVCRRENGTLTLGQPRDSSATVVDWVVKMRQLDDNQTLKHQLAVHPGGETPNLRASLQEMARRLARFYAEQAPVTVQTAAFRAGLLERIHENLTSLRVHGTSAAEIDTTELIHSYQHRFLALHGERFDDRVLDGRVVDGHGDLRPEHIYLNHPAVIIDCVEFNTSFRQNDPLDELAFLAMECDRLGAPQIGDWLFSAYQAESGDEVDRHLVGFYKTYRACVRAKVAALRCCQQDAHPTDSAHGEVRSYLALAAGYLAELGPPLLVLVGGHMGTGKTTFAARLVQQLGGTRISSDELRPPAATGDAYDRGAYTLDRRMENYRFLMRNASRELSRNATVFLDASFTTRRMRQLAKELADAEGAALLQLECVCPRETALQRIEDRAAEGTTASAARGELYHAQVSESEPPLATFPYLEIDTTQSTREQDRLAVDPIREILDQEGAR